MMGPMYERYEELRVKKNIKWKVVQFQINESELDIIDKHPTITEYRLWPREVECVGNFNVIHDTVILHSFVDPPRIIEIRDASFVIIFKNYFDMMWEKSEPIKV
jgi:hypothetical protein